MHNWQVWPHHSLPSPLCGLLRITYTYTDICKYRHIYTDMFFIHLLPIWKSPIVDFS